MDFSLPGSGLRERRRMAVVTRRIDRQRFGMTTRDYHRNRRLADLGFGVLLVAVLVAGAALVIG